MPLLILMYTTDVLCTVHFFFACHFSLLKFSEGQPYGKNLLLWLPQYFTPSDMPEVNSNLEKTFFITKVTPLETSAAS